MSFKSQPLGARAEDTCPQLQLLREAWREPHGKPGFCSMQWGPRKLVSDSHLRNLRCERCIGCANSWGEGEEAVWEACMPKKRGMNVSCGPDMSPPVRKPLWTRSYPRGPPGETKSLRYCWIPMALSKTQWTRRKSSPPIRELQVGDAYPHGWLEKDLGGTSANTQKKKNQLKHLPAPEI